MANSSDIPRVDTKTKQENLSLPDKEIGDTTRKRVTRRGVTWQTPLPGDEVEVHFTGQIKDGSYFDSSRDRATPLRFKLGQREVISGLDEGIATMKKGERAIFTIPPSLAYGEIGFSPLIPPNATLTFDVEMLSWNAIRDLTGDGGVMKKIVREGKGWATPKDGDEVTVQYEASLDSGTDLVPKSQGCVEFHVGHGGLCPAIHKAVKTMRRGEKAELTVKFSYGFGEDADQKLRTAGGFPLNSSASSIRLELLSWRSVVDVVGDRKILKTIIKAGEGFDRPADGSLVKVIYVGKLEEDGFIFDQKGSGEVPFEYTCLEEQVNEGLDRAIMTMRKGEKARLAISPDCELDSNGALEAALPNSRLIYEVELVDFTKEKPIWKMETREKIEMSEKKKQEGNALFRAGKTWQAFKKYEKAVKCVEFNHAFNEEENRVADALRASCYLNSAACKLKLGEYQEASKLCSKVLEHDPSNVKALYRRFQAYLKTSELERAEVDIRRALAIDPNNSDIKLELKLLKEKQKEQTICQAKLFTAMLSRTSLV